MTGAFQHDSWQIWTHFLDKLSCLSKSSGAQHKPPPPLAPYASLPALCHWTTSWWQEERRKPWIFREYVTGVKKFYYYLWIALLCQVELMLSGAQNTLYPPHRSYMGSWPCMLSLAFTMKAIFPKVKFSSSIQYLYPLFWLITSACDCVTVHSDIINRWYGKLYNSRKKKKKIKEPQNSVFVFLYVLELRSKLGLIKILTKEKLGCLVLYVSQ